MATGKQIVTVHSLPVRLMRLKDASKYLGMRPRKLRDMVQNGELPAIMPGGNAPWLVDVKDLDRWIDTHKS